ncbi:MAG: 50S ribosomal protein L10 [Candidatus Omnitrophica bacterium]|nr:50S ribosomal protein L10 [Candidatus Omnitrophota bacterium]MBL7151094.1 50S ribosomal protein L10 [Candidatus Omnitrophota bacterium]
MKKLGPLFKETSESIIKDRLKKSEAFLIIKHAGVSGPDLSVLRQSLKGQNGSFFVVKNSVARRALKNSGYDSLVTSVEGPCGLVFIKEDPVVTSKILCDFKKGHEKFILESGFLKDKVLAGKDIESMARLPSKEILRAQLVMTLNAPISGLVMALSQIIRKFVYCLDQIKEKKANEKPEGEAQ